MFAVIETGGKQYIVTQDQKFKIEKLPQNKGDVVLFDKVLLVSDDASTTVGTPYLEKASVEGLIVSQGRAKKIRMLRYHSKTRRRRRKGHRQHFTEVQITKIKK